MRSGIEEETGKHSNTISKSDLGDPAIRGSRLALPDGNDTPTESLQRPRVPAITLDIAPELGVPERDSRFRRVSETASTVAVPEAPMYEDRCTVLRQYDVRPSREIVAVQPKSETRAVQR